MPTVLAYVNEGRTIADCPVCNGAEFVERGKLFICQRCNPSIKGDKIIKIEGYEFTVKDPAQAVQARIDITASGRAYVVLFPDNFDAIWDVLRQRKNVTNMNWYPVGHPRYPKGETVQDLIIENAANGIGGE